MWDHNYFFQALQTNVICQAPYFSSKVKSIVDMVTLPTQVVAMKPRKGNKFHLKMVTQFYKSFLHVDCKTLSLAIAKNHKHFQSTCVIISMSPFISFLKFVVL
jgi:hypothetical protein